MPPVCFTEKNTPPGGRARDEVLRHDRIRNVTGLARHVYLSGEHDDRTGTRLAEQSSITA